MSGFTHDRSRVARTAIPSIVRPAIRIERPFHPSLAIRTVWDEKPLRVMLCGFDALISLTAVAIPVKGQPYTLVVDRAIRCRITSTLFGQSDLIGVVIEADLA